jgi:hypothetical protein
MPDGHERRNTHDCEQKKNYGWEKNREAGDKREREGEMEVWPNHICVSSCHPPRRDYILNTLYI